MALLPLPDGSAVRVREGETEQQAWERATRMYPEAFGITQQHGFYPAAKAGLREGLGAGIKGIGSLVGSQNMQAAGTAMMAPGQDPGAYHPYTDEEIAAQYKKGLLSGAGASVSKYVTEPLGGMVGRYGAPIAVGAAAAALAPEAAVAGIGAGALGTVAADAPMEIGENLERTEQRGAPVGGKVEQIAYGLAQASLLPLTGTIGQKMVAPFMKMMGPSLAETSRLVATGQMTKEAAVAQLNSLGKNMLIRTGETAAVGPALMAGTEALRTVQSGEDITSPEAVQRYKESVGAGLALAPLGALGGLGMRRGQVKEMGRASDEFSQTYSDAAKQNAAIDEQARRDAAWQAQQGEQQALPLEAPKQPKGGRAAYEATAEEPNNEILTRAFFNQHGIPNKGKTADIVRGYEGVSLADTEKIAELHSTLAALADSKDPHAGAYARTANTLEKYTRTEEAPVQAELPLPRVENPNAGQMQDMFSGVRAPVDMAPKEPAPLVTPEDIAARKAELYAEFERAHEKYKQTGDDTELNAIVAKAREEVGPADEALNQASTQKLFDKNGRPTVAAKRGVQNEPSPEVPPSADREGNGPDVQGPAAGGVSGAGVVPERTQPNPRVDEQPIVAEKPKQPALTTQQQIDALALENRTVKNQAKMQKLLAQRAAEQQAMSKNKGVGALTIPAEPQAAAVKQKLPKAEVTTAKKAAKEWEYGRGEDVAYPKYDELHPDAKDLLHARMDMHEKGLTGKDFKDVAQAHRMAERSDRIRREVAEELTPRSTDEAAKPAHTKEQAITMVKNISSKWKNAPDIAVKNLDELNNIERGWVEENHAAGYIGTDGKITIISDYNTNLHDVKATLFHEALGHYGLRTQFKADLQKMLRGMYDTHPGLKRVADEIRAQDKKLTPEQAVEEVLAEQQTRTPLKQSMLDRVVALVRSYLRKFGAVSDYSSNDVVSILRKARETVEKGPKTEINAGDQAARAKKEKPFSATIPKSLRVIIEREGADGKPTSHEVYARTEMAAAERRVAALDALRSCLNA